MNHPLETGDAEGWVSVDGGRLRTLLARTAYAMSQDESRPFLNGVYMLVRKGELRLVATDGHRLALARLTVEAENEMAGIVPRKAVDERAGCSAATKRRRWCCGRTSSSSGSPASCSCPSSWKARFLPTSRSCRRPIPGG